MASVGLLYVGAVLFINGIMLLGWLDAKSAAPMNFFVGALQVITPTYIIFTANGNQDTILAASGLYLFGFTYLYVGINLTAGLDGTGLGYFSLFVAVCAVVFSILNFNRFHDNAFDSQGDATRVSRSLPLHSGRRAIAATCVNMKSASSARACRGASPAGARSS